MIQYIFCGEVALIGGQTLSCWRRCDRRGYIPHTHHSLSPHKPEQIPEEVVDRRPTRQSKLPNSRITCMMPGSSCLLRASYLLSPDRWHPLRISCRYAALSKCRIEFKHLRVSHKDLWPLSIDEEARMSCDSKVVYTTRPREPVGPVEDDNCTRKE